MNNYIKTTILLLLPLMGISQSRWLETREIATARGEVNLPYTPLQYKSFNLDFESLVRDLELAPRERSENIKPIMLFPDPKGNLVEFYVVNSPVMESELAAKYPSIKSFKIFNKDHGYTGRIDISIRGFHGFIGSPLGDYYIDPYYIDNPNHYLVYWSKDSAEPKDDFICGVDHNFRNETSYQNEFQNQRAEIVNFHEYKFALACTGEWGGAPSRGTVEKVLADMNTGVNRVNVLFEKEFASRLIIINDNEKLIHLNGSTDPYNDPTQGRLLLGQNTNVVSNILGGLTSFDIGHIVTVNCSDVGGIASLGSACGAGNKAAGVTCAGSTLLNAAIRIMAHEVGHQLSAEHTFNVCDISSDQNAGLNGFEPGSGSTIMSYAGACGVNNVQNSEDEYYHQGSLFQIYNHTRNNNLNCPDITPTTNHFPTVNILTKNNTIIPKETPFILDGEGFDEDGDKLKFNFEEKDASTALCELGSPTGTCPQFRSVLPDTFPYRIIPRPSLLLSGTGDKDEVLPTYSRELKFAFTARDNNPEGGVASWKEFKIQVDASGGPFQVVSPNNGENYSQGQIIEALWNVSNTDKAPFHTEFVDIYLSTKNAIHPSNPNLLLLQGRVPNTGKAKIQLPDVVSNSVRLYIKAHNSIFFDMSNFKFILKEATTPTAYIKPNKYYDKLCLPALSTVNFQTTSIAGYNGMIKYELTSIPDLNIKASFEKEKTIAGEENNLNINFQNNILTGYYSIGYRIILDNNDTLYKKIDFDVISTDFSTVTTLFPNNGEKDAELPTFRWTGSPNATSYTIEVSKSPLFTTIEAGGTVTDTFYKPSKTFDKKSLYYWRVRANNECTEGEWLDIQAFGTLAQDCKNYSATGLPLNISQSGQPIITPKINIPTGTNISDVNVTKLKINHTNFADLTSTLISPVGTKVILWEKICPKSMNIEVLIDDQAPGAFSCANNASGQYTPKEKLSKFNGENATGAWTLEIQDGKTGNGGKLDIFELEICASVPVQDPYQVKNNLLTILPTDIGQISNEYLLVEDNNNNANELTYSLSKIPVYGNLLKNGTKLNVGDKFTQNDINTGALTYAYTGDINESVDDGFNFAVQDTEGGWLGINRFNIRVNSTTATKDEVYFYKVNIYPNPANDILNIEIVDSKAVFNKLIIRNTIGQEVLSQSITSNRAIVDIDNLDAGIYLLEITNGVKSITTKFIAQ